MKNYIKPSYELEEIEATDVVLTSIGIEYIGEGTLGGVTGPKGQVAMSFNDLLKSIYE